MEKVTHLVNGVITTDYKHYINAGGAVVLYIRRINGTNNTYYLTKDHLSSADLITCGADVSGCASGTGLVKESFSAFGLRRSGTDWKSVPSTTDMNNIAATTRQGFTGQEMMDNLNLVNMNGRIYNPAIGRFINPDPHVTDPSNAQNYNRYSYALNNPLKYNNPTGMDDSGDPCDACVSDPGGDPGSDNTTDPSTSDPNATDPSTSDPNLDPNTSSGEAPIGIPGDGGTSSVGGPSNGVDLEEVVVSGYRHSDDVLSPVVVPPLSATRSFRDVLDEIVVTGWKQKKLAGMKINFWLRAPQEQAWVVLKTGDIVPVPTKSTTVTDSCGREVSANTLSIPKDALALIHTHPNAEYPYPGPEDYNRDLKYPVYGITHDGVWVLPQGTPRGTDPEPLGNTPVPPLPPLPPSQGRKESECHL